MQTGEDLQGLRKIIDFTRLISIFILAIHFYFTCYAAFHAWGWTAKIVDRIVVNIAKTGLYSSILKPKLFALLFLMISLVGAKGRKEEKIDKRAIAAFLICGTLLYFICALCFYMNASASTIAILYIGITIIGYLLIFNRWYAIVKTN